MRRFATLFLVLLGGLHLTQAAASQVQRAPTGASGYSPQALPLSDAVKRAWLPGAHLLGLTASPAAWPTLLLGGSLASQGFTFNPGHYPAHRAAHAYQQPDGSYAAVASSIAAQSTPAGQTLPVLSVYPNPARGQTTVQVSGPGGADYQLRLSNVLGGEVRRLPVRPENPPAEGVALDLSSLPPGLYFCSLLVNDKTLVTKRLTVL